MSISGNKSIGSSVDEKELLKTCGLNPTEQKILLFLLENQRSSAGFASKRTGIKRPTVYSALLNLEGQGLVVRQKVKGIVKFATISPKTIPILIRNRALEHYSAIENATNVLAKKLPMFSKQIPHQIAGYEMTVIESYDAVYAVLENALTSGSYRGIFNPQTAFLGPGKALTERFLQIDSEKRANVKEIAVSGPLCDWYLELIQNPNHEVKQIAEDQTLPVDFVLLRDAAVIINYENDAAMGIIIKHQAFIQFMDMLFQTLWNNLK